MVDGTLRWLSTTKDFGLIVPVDGSRAVFVRLSSRGSLGITRDEDRAIVFPVGADVPAKGPDEDFEPLGLATKVEVRTRYQVGHWARGYEVAEVVDAGYHVRRPGLNRQMLPEIFGPADVRRAGDR